MKTTSRSARSARIATRSPLRSSPGPGDRDQPRVHLARHDVRERRLAEARRPREQHVVDRLAALLRGRQRDRELLAHDLLADELVELARPQRAVGLVLVAARRRGTDQALVLAHTGLPRRSAASPTLTRCSVPPSAPASAASASAHREAERDERVARGEVRISRARGRPRPRRPRRPRGPRRRACRAARPRCARRCACRCPRPRRAAPDRLSRCRAGACRRGSPRAARAPSPGPRPETPSSATNSPRSRAFAKP